MRRLIIGGIFVLIVVLGMSLISFADSSDLSESSDFPGVPSWDYDHNDNVPGFVDKDGNLIPNIYIGNNMILVDVYGKWAQEAITYCAEQGYLDGMLSRKYFFNPESGVWKSDLVLFLGRKEGIEYSRYAEDCFSDIKLEDYDLSGSYDYSDWYSNFSPYYVNWAGAEGILKGSGQGILNNIEGLTREQAATIIDRYIVKKTTLYERVKFDEALNYKDQDQIADWAREGVERLSKIKLFNGDQNGRFNPKKGFTRAEVCQIIFNLAKMEASNSL